MRVRQQNEFKRAYAMFLAIAAAQAIPLLADRMLALDAVGAYKSRGKGRGTASKRYGNQAGKYTPHQGYAECERRRSRA